jgi:hypothetical protein
MKHFTAPLLWFWEKFRRLALHCLKAVGWLVFKAGQLLITLGRHLWSVSNQSLNATQTKCGQPTISESSPKAGEPATSHGSSGDAAPLKTAPLIMHPLIIDGQPSNDNIHAYVQCVGYIAYFVKARAEYGDVTQSTLVECFGANVMRKIHNHTGH